MTDRLLALSWKQPYADLMLHGKIETRSWETSYRGLVLICSTAKGFSPEEVYAMGPEQFCAITEKLRAEYGIDKNADVIRWVNYYRASMAIAVGRLADCRPMKIEDEYKAYTGFAIGAYSHVYEDVRRIKPFFWKGVQGFKEVPQSIKDKIEYIDPKEFTSKFLKYSQ